MQPSCSHRVLCGSFHAIISRVAKLAYYNNLKQQLFFHNVVKLLFCSPKCDQTSQKILRVSLVIPNATEIEYNT